MEEIYGSISYCCNKGNVTAEYVSGGVVGNNKGEVSYVYNIAETINTKAGGKFVGGIVGTQNVETNSVTKYAYNKANLSGYSNIGGVIAEFAAGTIDHTYHMGTINATSNVAVGEIVGSKSSNLTPTNSKNVTEVEMKGWSQTTINTNLPNFVKKTNGLPILNITVRGITF